MSMEDTDKLLKKWLNIGSWITCQIEEKKLEMRKMYTEESENSEILVNCEWLDKIQYFTEQDEAIERGTDNNEVSDFDEDSYYPEKDHIDEGNNGKVLPLFISQALCAKKHNESFKLGSLIFKCVQIYGTVTETRSSFKNNFLVIDDGTAQITCIMGDSINEKDDLNECSNIIFDDPNIFNQFFNEEKKENEFVLPCFNDINQGDKVLIDGDLALFEGKYYIFIESILRGKGLESLIKFNNVIYHLIDIGYYDFTDI